ncbi:hypothetical protein N9H68_07365 [Planktomarina temperata]|nr:hypothetical protein [Planktomarina temperata]
MTIQQHASFDSSAAELNATSKLVKAWESKNAKNAAKFGGISLMALSLAACSGSDDAAAVVDGGTAADDTAADDTAVTTVAAGDVQQLAAQFLTTISTGNEAAAAATITAASSAAVLAANEQTAATASTTQATANTAIEALTTAAYAELGTGNGVGGDGLESAETLVTFATDLGANFAAMVTNASGVTAAQKTAYAAAIAEINDALGFEAQSDAAALVPLFNTAGAGAASTAAEDVVLNTIVATATLVGTNNYIDNAYTDTTALTAAETLAGNQAIATSINATLLANSATYTTAWDLLTAAQQATVIEAIAADATITGAASSTTSGAVVGITSYEAVYDAAALIIAGDGTGAGGGAAGLVLNTGGAAGTAHTDVTGATGTEAVVVLAAAGGAVDPIAIRAEDNAHDAAAMADIAELIASAQAVAATSEAGNIAAIQAGLTNTESLGADNIVLMTAAGRAGTDGNDVFVYAETGGNVTVGTAATALAPENVFWWSW